MTTSIRPAGWTLAEWREDDRRQDDAYAALSAAVTELDRVVIIYRPLGETLVLAGGDLYDCDLATFELLNRCSDLRPAPILAGSPETN